MKRVLVLAALAACGDPPPFALKFNITDGDVQTCTNSAGDQVTSCSDVRMLCDAVVSIRIFAPSDPTAPFISVCQPLLGTGNNKNLCQIAGVNLTPPAMPTKLQELEVDMVVYRKDDLETDAMGNPICPADVSFGGDGFLAPPAPCTADPCPAAPAVGGRAFYHPGDSETVVTLGCADLSELNACVAENTLTVDASVIDFDTAVSVSSTTADSLLVSVGEPAFDSAANGYVLKSTNTFPLMRRPVTPVPAWTADIMGFTPVTSACIEVFEDGAQTTAAVTCTNANIGSDPLDLPGIRLAKGTLDNILAHKPGGNEFPLQGMVVGKALTYLGGPANNVTITPSNPSAHILYMSEDGMSFSATGPTTDQGIWISLDAPYGTVFHAAGSTAAPDAFGGLIAGKADIVISQLKPPGNM